MSNSWLTRLSRFIHYITITYRAETALILISQLICIISHREFNFVASLNIHVASSIAASNSVGHIVNPGEQKTYTYSVPWSVTPGSEDPPCLTYMYYSAYESERDVSSGLVGPFLICKTGAIDPSTGRQVKNMRGSRVCVCGGGGGAGENCKI